MKVYSVTAEGLDNLADRLGDRVQINEVAAKAINRTAIWARDKSADRMRRQINWPANYLKPESGRLKVAVPAAPNRLRAVVIGRQRPTSLARFLTSQPTREHGASVRVKAGGAAKRMPRAFTMRLRQGRRMDAGAFNVGLAIRLRPGERVHNKREMVRVGKGLYLLYGPSVDQIFRQVSNEIAPDAARELESEFTTLMEGL